jgi:hypothetical protein
MESKMPSHFTWRPNREQYLALSELSARTDTPIATIIHRAVHRAIAGDAAGAPPPDPCWWLVPLGATLESTETKGN